LWATNPEESTAIVIKEEKKINTQIKTSKEIHSLADLKAERERQDNLWK
jgi:hypothetical protein